MAAPTPIGGGPDVAGRPAAGHAAAAGAVKPRSTLFTSPRSQLDFGARLLFFALAPFAIVPLAAVFPIAGALVNIAIALAVFIAEEALRARAERSRLLRWFFERELDLAAYYAERPPRPFFYYVFYPLLFPYWLVNRSARREFWLFKGYTIATFLVLLGSVAWQYFAYWWPELGLRAYAKVVALTLGVETLFVLALLMPMATTVIGFHGARRRWRLGVLLAAALLSTGVSLARVVLRRAPVVSYSTRERVRARTAKQPRAARDVQIAALREAWRSVVKTPGALEEDGKVEGAPIDRARAALRKFYKNDETFSFTLWASPRRDPRILVLYVEAWSGRAPIWAAMKLGGEEVRDPKQMPKGAFRAMERAAD